MKVMFYINTLVHGGAERVLCSISSGLFDLGNECIFVTSNQIANEYPLAKGIKRITLLSGNRNPNFIIRNFKLITQLRKVVNKEKPDVLISFMAEPNFRSIIATLGLKTKTVVSVRNDPKSEYPSFVSKLLAQILYGLSNAVVFQTPDASEFFSKKIKKRGIIIHNPISNAFFTIQHSSDRKNIVAAGRLVPQKNHKLLIKAFSMIADQVDSNLIIYGDGDLRDDLVNYCCDLEIDKRVEFPGVVDDMPLKLNNAKVFVLSSDFEGMPNALMEAMALGVPCISTNCPCGGAKLLLGNNENGLLVPVGDAKSLSDSILKLLKNESLANQLGIRAKEFALNFRLDIVSEKWDQLIKDL